jgi:hypothetical protein
LIRKKVKDKRVLALVEAVVRSSFDHEVYDAWGGAKTVRRTGIPIGNLTSQLFANLYLSELDDFIKHSLHEGLYVRYMDDFLMLSSDKARLQVDKKKIASFLKNRLRLRLHPKKATVFPVNVGIDFLGYRIFSTHRLLRKSTVRRFVKRTRKYRAGLAKGDGNQKEFTQSLASWQAYAEFGDSYHLRTSLGTRMGL